MSNEERVVPELSEENLVKERHKMHIYLSSKGLTEKESIAISALVGISSSLERIVEILEEINE